MTLLARHVAFVLVLVQGAMVVAHESPVDHVDRELRLWWTGGRLHVSYRLILTERAALLQLHSMDRDRDGKISEDERQSFLSAAATELAGRFRVTIGGHDVRLRPDGEVTLDPALGQTFNFVADEIPLPAGKHAGELLDFHSRSYPGPYRLLPTTTASAGAIEIPQPTAAAETHPGMVVVRFELTIPSE